MIFSCSTMEPGQPWRDDQRQRILVLRAHVDEVDVQSVDLGEELREGVQSRLAPAPVVLGGPVVARAPAWWRAVGPATDRRRSPSRASAWPRCAHAGRRGPLRERRCGRGGLCCLRPLRPAPPEAGREAGRTLSSRTLSSQSLRLLSSVHGDKPLERFGEERDIGGSLGLRFRATSQVTRYAGQVSEPEEIVRLGSGPDDLHRSTCTPGLSGGQFGASRGGTRLEGGRRMSQRETEHLRVLIANERKDRLALVAPIVAALGTRSSRARSGSRTSER